MLNNLDMLYLNVLARNKDDLVDLPPDFCHLPPELDSQGTSKYIQVLLVWAGHLNIASMGWTSKYIQVLQVWAGHLNISRYCKYGLDI